MSMAGNIAVEMEMKKLLKMMDKFKSLPLDEQLKLLRDEIKSVHATAKSGWL